MHCIGFDYKLDRVGYLHKLLSRHSWAQELGKVGKLLPLKLLMKLDNELQILGTEARDQAVLHLQARVASCTRPARRRTNNIALLLSHAMQWICPG